MSLTHAITVLLLLSFAIESIVTAVLSALHPRPRGNPPSPGIAPNTLRGENLTQPANPPNAQASRNDEEKERQEEERWKRKDQLWHLGLRALMAPVLAACLVYANKGGDDRFLGGVKGLENAFQFQGLDMLVTALLLMAGADGIQGLRKQLGASGGGGGKPRGNSPPKPQPEGVSLKLRVDPIMLGQALAEAKKALRKGEEEEDEEDRGGSNG